jgi:HEAT repeat protein
VLIGELGAEAGDAVVALQQLLQQDEDAVVLASAFALGNIGPAAKDALPDLKRLLAAGRPEPVANEIRRAVQVLEVQHGRS